MLLPRRKRDRRAKYMTKSTKIEDQVESQEFPATAVSEKNDIIIQLDNEPSTSNAAQNKVINFNNFNRGNY